METAGESPLFFVGCGVFLASQEEAVASHKNNHIHDYLSYYLGLSYAPNYAVLVSGPWGVGKTYLVKDFLSRELDPKERKYVYVSLYGLSSLEEVDEALLEAIYPALGWKATKIGARIGKSLLKRAGVDPDIKIIDLVNKFNSNVFIFDDLERCEAPINKVLGYINRFVEHDGCRVIIVANEAEISDSAGYSRRREKLIGKTLEVQSVFEEAFAHFISRIKTPEIRAIFEANSPEIAAIYDQSDLNNLRVLQQTMWDFERFCESLEGSYRANQEAMTALLQMIFSFSFEIKAGRIKLEDLASRMDFLVMAVSKNSDEPKSALMLASERYPEIDLSDLTISNEILVDVLIKGIVDGRAIMSALDKSRYFITVAQEPAWRTVWNCFERTDAEFARAFIRMEKQFSDFEIVILGELLHVFGLRLFLSDAGVLKLSRDEVVAQGKLYIDELYKRNGLPLDLDASTEIRFGGYGGLGIHENKTPEYKQLFLYLQERVKQALDDSYPSKAAVLLKEMKSDPALFLRRVCLTNSEENVYYRVPILASLAPEEFVSSFLELHPAHQRTVMMALQSGYEHNALERDLAMEKNWLTSMVSRLDKEAEGLPAIGKYRVLKNIEWFIAPVPSKQENETGQEDA